MPQITECRIGNLCQTKDGYVKVISLKFGGPMITEPWPHRMAIYDAGATVDAIPFNEEWLEKIGFEPIDVVLEDGERTYYSHTRMNELKYTDANRMSYAMVWDDIDLPHIKFVHQLQNLYFALIGEELIIKP